MEKGSIIDRKSIPLAFRAEKALKEAVSEAIVAHARAGVPVVVWRNGEVFKYYADQIEIREPSAEYRSIDEKDE